MEILAYSQEVLSSNNYWILRDKSFSIFRDLDSVAEYLGTKQTRNDLIYLEMASVWAKNSKCVRNKVGCLIVNNKCIVSDGYNGTPSGFPNECEDDDGNTKSCVLHAESNAIAKLAKSTQTSENSTLYVTLSPCFECAKMIIQSGIKKVVFKDLYRKIESLDLLQNANIEILRINN